jgi:SAM-dependent methyltransferase
MIRVETAADVRDLLGVPTTSAAVGAALELGLFWMLADRPRTASSLAEGLGIPRARCRYWLGALAAVGLLTETDEGFALSPTGRVAIVEGGSPDAWQYLAMEAREHLPLVLDLPQRLRRDGAVTDDAAATTDYVEKLRADPDRARRFTHLLYELHGWLADAVAETVQLPGARWLLDVGGGSGVVSLALLRRHPALSAVVVDLPAVCVAGREIADATGEAARISYRPLDYRDGLPDGFDVIMTCDAAFDRSLMTEIARVLPEGGTYLLVDRWIDTGPAQRAALAPELFEASLVDPALDVPTVEDLSRDLRSLGLEPAPPIDLQRPMWKVVTAEKVGTATRIS